MCSFLVTNKNIDKNLNCHHTLKNRGPDSTNIIKHQNFTFMHNLLSLTGNFTIQPIIKNNVVYLFNGEIYNYLNFGNYESDIFAIIDLYEKKGINFTDDLDGEYAIIIYDDNIKTLYFTTDIFGIKPIYYSFENSIGISSYKEPLLDLGFNNVIRVEPNCMMKFDVTTSVIEKVKNLHLFDLKQYKNSYDDWTQSFLQAIKKRFYKTNYPIILPLSSGHDSGAIACALDILEIEYYSFSFIGSEDIDTLNKRLNIRQQKNKDMTFYENSLNHAQRIYTKNLINNRCSSITYGNDLNYKNHVLFGEDDPGANGLAYILQFIKNKDKNIKILASGQGGDEITTNLQTYKFGKANPEIFPNDLSSVFPWDNFYYGAQSSYLCKEENISGGFGIEGRYPFLDKQVVQEFLWLNPELKNKYYKAPITNFLNINQYPIFSGKRGFNI